VHFEDQLASEKKCGHLGGKVLVPTGQFVRTLAGARLAADVLGVPTVLVARTDALSATLLTSDVDERDRHFLTGERTPEGYFRVRGGIESATARGLAYAPYADLIWCETSTPDLDEARQFAEGIHARFPHKMLAYNCSPSFNWQAKLDAATIAKFQRELGAMGYKFQFITLAGWHLINLNAFELARAYRDEGMPAYVRVQAQEFAREKDGYTATRHQREAGTGYFDDVLNVITQGQASTGALAGSTEAAQFHAGRAGGGSGTDGKGSGGGGSGGGPPRGGDGAPAGKGKSGAGSGRAERAAVKGGSLPPARSADVDVRASAPDLARLILEQTLGGQLGAGRGRNRPSGAVDGPERPAGGA
jgi:isocitrate lyase